MFAKVDASGSALASWSELVGLLGAFAVVLVVLFVLGSRGPDRPKGILLRVPIALERMTGVAGWAAATVGLSLFGLLVAGQGFYSDVSWHITLGRDDILFTAPHTAIVLGLGMIFLAGLVGVLAASLQRVETDLRFGDVRVPWSTLPLLALGGAALMGFPLDEVWHRTYGVDVTMWSPTHMLMILGASFSGLASWLVLAEAGVRPDQSRWSRGMLAVAGWLTLQGLAAPLGEFTFGVPQFQQMFHPLLLCVASGFALVAIRLVHGRGWAVGITVFNLVLMRSKLLDFGGAEGTGPVQTRDAGLFVVAALVVELAALALGTRRSMRFAVAAGIGVGTIGLAGEWLWNADAYQPWTSNLLPDAVIMGTLAAVGAAIVGVAFARAAGGPGLRADVSAPRGLAVAAAAVLVVVLVALPLPRRVGNVTATVRIDPAGQRSANDLSGATEQAFVEVVLEPADAARDARWFQASAWQGGGLVLSDLEQTAPGTYRSQEPVPVGGRWKTLVRLHRGSELMAVPVFLPSDPEIDASEIAAVGRRQRFESETRYLLRETHPGAAGVAVAVYSLLVLAMAGWATSFALACRGATERQRQKEHVRA